MSKALVYSEGYDDEHLEILGIKATMMTQREVLCRASGSIQAPLKKSEREFISRNAKLPLPVPIVPLDHAVGGKFKPKTVMCQLNDNHLGTTQFRSLCSTCGLGSDKCSGKSAVHVLSEPTSPVSHAPVLLAIAKATCFACSRFLSVEYEEHLSCEPILDYQDCADLVHEHGKSNGGRMALASVEESMARWNKFCDVSIAINRRLFKHASAKGLSAIECQHCGVIQPSEIAMHQKVIATSWDLKQTLTNDDGSLKESCWKPSNLFWQKLFVVLHASDTNDCQCSSSMTGPCAIDGVQWVVSRLLKVMKKQTKTMNADQVWLMRVLPFVFGGEVLQNTLSKSFSYANLRIQLQHMRHQDIWRMGKSPIYSHPQDFIWLNFYIGDRSIRPIVQEASGGMIRANDPRTESYEKIIKQSAKLRKTVLEDVCKPSLESWCKMCKYPDMSTFLDECFADTTDIFYPFEYAGDVRLGFAPLCKDVVKHYSNLQHEISSVFDHTVEANMTPKSHNSAATGAKNAKEQAKTGRKFATLTDDNDFDGEMEAVVAPAPKRKAKKNLSSAGGAKESDVQKTPLLYHGQVDLRASQLPCPCLLFDGMTGDMIDDDALPIDAITSFGWQDGAFGLSLPLQKIIWLKSIAQIIAQWSNFVVDHAKSKIYDASDEPIQVSHVAHSFVPNSTILVPSTLSELEAHLAVHCKDDEQASQSTLQQIAILKQSILQSKPLNHYAISTKLPSPEQFSTAQFRGGGSSGAANQKSSNLKKDLDGKTGLFRHNGITKRLNHSARFVLVPDGSIPVDHVGLPYRLCLGQTHPVIVSEANRKLLQVKLAKARYWSFLGMLPDLGGIESVVTLEGIQIAINNVIVPSEHFFDDQVFCLQMEKKASLQKNNFLNNDDLVEKWGAPLHVGWTCNVYLQDGDHVIISRPPALQRHNHCAHQIIAMAGFVIRLPTSVMEGFAADADGDAMMVSVMQSILARASIRILMPLSNSMMCPRKHAIICALQQDALLGTCLLISESDRFRLAKGDAIKLASCFRLVQSERFCRVGFKGRGDEWIDAKTRYGPLWRLTIPNSKSDQSIRIPPPCGRDEKNVPYWTGLQFVEESFPKDFCYYKRLKGCAWSIMRVLNFVTELALVEKREEQDAILNRYKTNDMLPDNLVIIWKGRWIIGQPNSATFGTSADGIIEALWRHYGKNFACDWMGDMCFLAQTYLSEIRGFSCSVSDMIMGGRSKFSLMLKQDVDGGDKMDILHNDQAEGDDDNDDDRTDPKFLQTWPNHFAGSDIQVSKLSYLKHVESLRQKTMDSIETAFSKAGQYMDSASGQITYDQVSQANAKLDEYANIMLMYGANMFAAHNTNPERNNISLMAKTGSKGNSTNTAMMSATLGVAKIKGTRAVGHGVQPTTRTFVDEAFGEKTASSLGFINRGFILGLTGKQFFQTSREARNRIKNCSDPSKSGYLQTQVGVNSQNVSVRMDGTVRNQQNEIVQLNYGGDGYDACKVKRIRVEPEMFVAAFDVQDESTKHQLDSIIFLVMNKIAQRPENDFASVKTIMSKGLFFQLNVDVPGLFLLHSGLWSANGINGPACSTSTICLMFGQFCSAVLAFDRLQSLMPFELFLVVRLYLLPSIFGPMSWCSEQDLTLLLNDIYKTYCENMADPGEAVGPLACQSTNQPTTQLIMKSFKTDVANAKEALHLGSDMSRISEIFAFTDPKAAISNIVLSPEWVSTEKQALFVASQFVGVLLSDWVVKNGFGAEWVNLQDFSRHSSLLQAKQAILLDYETSGVSKMPVHHEICYWRLKSHFWTLAAVAEYLALFVDEHDETSFGEHTIEHAIGFIEQVWHSCLTGSQMGGVMIEEVAQEGDSGGDLSESNPFGVSIVLWMAFRHTEKDLESGMFDETGTRGRSQAWMSQMFGLVFDLTFSLTVVGNSEVEQLLSCEPPAILASSEPRNDDSLTTGLPDIAHCFRLRFKSKRLLPFLSHPCVVDQLCYTSNLKELRDVFGIEAVSQMLALEASRILSSEVDVYVQTRHLQLLADIMTSEGDVMPMNQHGFKRRMRTSFFAQLSHEDVTGNLIRGGINGRYDAFDHIVPNIMFAQRDAYIGSGSCRVVASPSSSSPPETLPPDYESVNISHDACDLYNLFDFVVGSSFSNPKIE